jgi:hypothetical protein
LTRSLATLALVVLAFPSVTAGGTTPTRSDRTAKLDLIAHLKQPPQTLILGDSRGREASPSYLRQLTGHSAFNAAVTGGSAPDAWVFTRYAQDLFPLAHRRYIFFVSAGLTANIVEPVSLTDPRSRRYLAEVSQYVIPETGTPPATDTRYHADGSIADWNPSYSPARAAKLRAAAARLVAQIRAHPPAPTPVDTSRFQLFEHLLAYMNGLGSRPVIVFNPIYPTVLAELEKHGNPLTAGSLAYLESLQARYDFVVVNCEDSRTWHGTDYDWANPTHVDAANMRRMLRYIVAHSDGALR